jgi:hypothetical protein
MPPHIGDELAPWACETLYKQGVWLPGNQLKHPPSAIPATVIAAARQYTACLARTYFASRGGPH